jgi:hypothetical protein
LRAKEYNVRSTVLILTICAAMAFAGCGYSAMPGNNTLAPIVTGAWTMTFTPMAQGSVAPPATMLHVNFTQNGSSLSGTVTAVNNPANSCFPLITTQSTFSVTGQAVAQSQSNSNLNVSVAFTSGSSSGTIMGTGALVYLGTMATGTFSFPTGAAGCTSGTFTMSQG